MTATRITESMDSTVVKMEAGIVKSSDSASCASRSDSSSSDRSAKQKDEARSSIRAKTQTEQRRTSLFEACLDMPTEDPYLETNLKCRAWSCGGATVNT
jgi:hypothetical protein